MRLPISWIALAFLAAVVVADAEQEVSILVKVVTSDKAVVVGEIGRENDTHIEVFDLKTGRAQVFRKDDLQSLRKDISEEEAIASVGLPTCLAGKIRRALPTGGSGAVAKVDGAVVYVSLGSKQGIDKGHELLVYRGEEELKDPVTGRVLGKERRRIARLEVLEPREDFCKARLSGDLEIGLRTGDVVEAAKSNRAIVILPLVNAEGNETDEGKQFAEELTTGLVSRAVSVVERTLLNKVLAELGLQQTAAFDAAQAQRVGRQLGAYAVLAGTLMPKKRYAEAQIRLIRVETGEILVASSQKVLGAAESGTAPATATIVAKSAGKGMSRLFDGKTLNGWHLYDPNAKMCWDAHNGELVCIAHPLGANLVTDQTFEDFELHLEFLLQNGGNSGVYLRGLYEVQLLDHSSRRTTPTNQCGAIHGQIAPSASAYLGPNRWNLLEVRLIGRTVTVVMNGKRIINSAVIARPTGTALHLEEGAPGPIMLQNWAKGVTRFRNIQIRVFK